MIDIFIFAAIAAAGCLFLVFKFGKIRRVLAFDIPIDIIVTLSLVLGMAGTFSGIMIALVAGTIVSATLFIMKKLVGTDMLTASGWKTGPKPMTVNNIKQKFSLSLK